MVSAERPIPAPCRIARRLLIVIAGICLLAGSLPIVDLLLRSGQQDHFAAEWITALHLSAPALGTAGTPQRHPETVHPAIDLRFMAGSGSFP